MIFPKSIPNPADTVEGDSAFPSADIRAGFPGRTP